MRAKRELKEQIVSSLNPNNGKYITCIRRLLGLIGLRERQGGGKEQLESRRKKRRRRRAPWRSQGIPENLQGQTFRTSH